MRVYILEFTFSGVDWKQITLEITAQSKIQLMKMFLEKTQRLNNHSILRHGSKKEAIKDLWNTNKGKIVETELIFPSVRIIE